MQKVIVLFEGSEQNAHDLISNMPAMVSNVGATFVEATRVEDAPVAAPVEETVPTEAHDETANQEETVTGSQPEEPKPGFLGELSEAENEMEKE